MSETNPEKKSLFDKMIKTIRLTGALLGCVVVAIGVIFLVIPGQALNPRNVINSIYLIIFGSLMIIAEMRWQRLLKYTYFLQHFIGLGMFYIFVGGLSLGGDWWQWVVSIVCLTIGIIYFILGLGCRRMGKENFQMSGLRTGEVPAPGGGAPAPGGSEPGKSSDDSYGQSRGGYGGAQGYAQSYVDDYARSAYENPAVQRAVVAGAVAGAQAAAPAAIREVRSAYGDQEYV